MISSDLKKVDFALVQEILTLKEEKNALILAHFYQEPIVQELADHVGDSLDLSRKAKDSDKKLILFAGVHFMAETAKILNPESRVILPDPKAGCSLADSCKPDDFRTFVSEHPGHVVISYINCSAEIKAMSDIVCTSSNAREIVNSVPRALPIIFAPDANLGAYLAKECKRELLLWQGACEVHEAFSMDKILNLTKKHPKALLIAHPESKELILRAAAFIGSTAKLLNYVKSSPADEFIIATEAGILHEMQKQVPSKKLIPAPIHEDNSCACSECAYMKLNSLEKIRNCLRDETPEIDLDQALIEKATKPLERMFVLSR